MLDFVSLVQERGGPLLDAELLRAEYQRRLDAAIATRSDQIRRGKNLPTISWCLERESS